MEQRYCFVTVGATAAFDALITAVLQIDFLRALAEHGYTDLVVQFGRDGKNAFVELVQAAAKSGKIGLKISGFDLTKNLRETMRLTKGENGRQMGLVICHAGTGSVLDAMRIQVPVVVVPNTSLMDNHQVEFAEQMSKMGYAIYGDISNLAATLPEAEEMKQKFEAHVPINSGDHGRYATLSGVLDEEMGIEIAGHIE